ncbi:unnamed protein product, partial [Allacma fusca]
KLEKTEKGFKTG